MQQQLRRITDRVVQTGSQAAGQASRGLVEAGKRGNEAARSAYGYAMNHPRTAAAVVLGTGVAAALIWMVRRNGGYTAIRRKMLARVRGSTRTSSRSRRQPARAE
jgi:hypothetical protein